MYFLNRSRYRNFSIIFKHFIRIFKTIRPIFWKSSTRKTFSFTKTKKIHDSVNVSITLSMIRLRTFPFNESRHFTKIEYSIGDRLLFQFYRVENHFILRLLNTNPIYEYKLQFNELDLSARRFGTDNLVTYDRSFL